MFGPSRSDNTFNPCLHILIMILLYQGEEPDANFYYHSGVDIDHAFLLMEGKRKTLLVHEMNAAVAKATFSGRVVVYKDAMAALTKLLRRKTVLYDSDSISVHLFSRLKSICAFKDHSQELARMRVVKSSEEVSKVAKAARCAKEILESLELKKGMTELDVKKKLLLATLEMGLEISFEPIVATDLDSSFPHSHAGKKKLGSILLVDFGVKYDHYCSDLTRCFILDGDRKKKEQYERLKDICWFIVDSLPQMTKGSEVSALADDLMAKAGFPKMIHSIGHGVGLEVHEHPGLGPKSADPISNTTMAIEPAFYLSRYGMRYEETVHNSGKRSRVL